MVAKFNIKSAWFNSVCTRAESRTIGDNWICLSIHSCQKSNKYKQEKQKIKAAESIKKRFNTLYKSLLINERAVYGFVELNDEMKIKAEEVIHQLNDDPSVVTIKRKVFGGKGQKTVFEVVFAYKGRLYFRNLKNRRVEVLAVGTKNTQAKELEFLAGL